MIDCLTRFVILVIFFILQVKQSANAINYANKTTFNFI